ncbi:MAG: hypothetical protein QOF24_2314 [Verrucomicrobiota bacterium]|jgi:uncharacterized protein (TIGR02680 family)
MEWGNSGFFIVIEEANRNGTSACLPEAKRERWQPIRGGLLNIYRYDFVEFRYEHGRLLLRGNNGTGKSRVLALQLPFLLDGEIMPQRVEPDGDIAKRMDWNLLLGKYDDRLGYTWIEFGRKNADGATEYTTLGCGLRAVATRGIVARWYFVTNLRVGRDLFLQGDAGQPLSRQKLEAALGANGRIYDKADEYRRAVDFALFKLGDRYDALLNLLIQLRQPQLSRKLDEQKLSNALSQALPPLSDRVLADVAEAFRSLESDRDELNNFVAARDAADLFLKDYRRYTQIAARRRAKDLREKHSAYETIMRRLRAAEAGLEAANRELANVHETIAKLIVDEERANAVCQALHDSPQMKDARELDAARRTADSSEVDAESARKENEQAAADLQYQEIQVRLETKRLTDAWKKVEHGSDYATARAKTADLEKKHTDTLARLQLPDVVIEHLPAAEESLRSIREGRMKAVRHLAKLNEAVAAAQGDHKAAKQALDDLESQFTEATERQREAKSALEREVRALLDSYTAWNETLTELRPTSPSEFEQAFHDWRQSLEGESPLVAAVRRSERETLHKLASQRAERVQRRDAINQEVESIAQECDRLERGYHEPPPPPHTRDVAGRKTRAGAPLWSLCDFAPSIPASNRPNIEAALEAAGLLDAWVTPDGRLLDRWGHDTILVAHAMNAAPVGRQLNAVLTAAVAKDNPQASAVTDNAVAGILAHIGFGKGAGDVWVDVDGSWRVGPLYGAWSKSETQHIGHVAREADRCRRIDQLKTKFLAAAELRAQMEQEIEALDARGAVAAREVAAAPSDGQFRHDLAAVNTARQVVEDTRLRLKAAETRVTESREALTGASEERDRDATEFGLLPWIGKLDDLKDAVHAYGEALAGLFPAIQAYSERRSYAAGAEKRVKEASRIAELRARKMNEARGKSEAARARFETLDSSVGAGVKEVQEKLAAAETRLVNIRAVRTEREQEKQSALIKQGVESNKIAEATSALGEADVRRSAAVTGLNALVLTRVLGDAHSDFRNVEPGEWSVTRGVDLARRIETAFSEIESDDDAWSRNQRAILGHFETLQTALRSHGYMPEGTMIDELFVVTVPFQSRSCTMTELRDAVLDEILERQTILDARERDVLEKHLIKDVAEHLHNLLHNALKWVDEMNAEIQSRPMSTGMTLRFKWEPLADGPQAFAEARDLLLRARGTWAPDERLAVGQFLHQQIKAVRAENDTGTWQEHLTFALDYRRWHQFAVERKQDGVWKRLTKRTHGTGSGGEKAIALTLPQFAAAAAHYRTADARAPRLILLDEAFVGVDSDMRSKCMDLLTAFDLDFVMTSEREWGCYPTVPAVAIYQLSARAGIDAVGVTRWVWNGKQRVRDDSPMCEPFQKMSGTAVPRPL